MTNISQHAEPRSRTLLRHTRQAIADGQLRVLPFSERVASTYLSAVQPEDRAVPLREDGETVDSALKARGHNHKVIDRLISGTVKTFPADLEDSWVAQLPAPYRERCVRDLAARAGLVAVRDPRTADSPETQGGELCALLKEVGEVAARLAPIFADGKVDGSDMPHISPALDELGDLLTQTLQLHRRLTKVVTEAASRSNVVTKMRA